MQWNLYENKLNMIDQIAHELDGVYAPMIMQLGFTLKKAFSKEQTEEAWNKLLELFPKLNSKVINGHWIAAAHSSYFRHVQGDGNFPTFAKIAQSLKIQNGFQSILQVASSETKTYFLFSIHHAMMDGYGLLSMMRTYVKILYGEDPTKLKQNFSMPAKIQLPVKMPKLEPLIANKSFHLFPIEGNEPAPIYKSLVIKGRIKPDDLLSASVKAYREIFQANDKKLMIRIPISLRHLLNKDVDNLQFCPLYNLTSAKTYVFDPNQAEDRAREIIKDSFQSAPHALGTWTLIKLFINTKTLKKKSLQKRDKTNSYNVSFNTSFMGNMNSIFGEHAKDVMDFEGSGPFPGFATYSIRNNEGIQSTVTLSAYNEDHLNEFHKRVEHHLSH